MNQRSLAIVASLLAALVAWSAPGQSPAASANGADFYRQAAEWWQNAVHGESPLLSSDEVDLISMNGVDGAPSEAQLAAYRKVQPYLELVRQGASAAQCDFQLDRSQGFDLLLPHLAQLRQATRLMRFEAELRMQQGDYAGAVDSLGAISRFAHDVRGDSIIISSLVTAAMLSMGDSTMETLLDAGAIDAAGAERLMHGLAGFRGSDPTALSDAIRGEGEMLHTSIERVLSGGEPIEDLFFMAGGDGDAVAGLTPEAIRSQVAATQQLYAEVAEATANPDRAAAKAALDAISERIEAGEGGIVARMLMPAFSRAVEVNWTTIDKLAGRFEQLEALRSGKAKPMDLANAAPIYLRIATLFAGLPRERQADLEAARVAIGALDDDGKARAREIVAPTREALQAAFLAAAPCGRCVFADVPEVDIQLLPAHLPGLRAAARAMLADAELGDSPNGPDGRIRGSATPAATPVAAIAATLRLAQHLSLDPRLGQSLVAASLLEDAAEALRDAIARDAIDVAGIERVAALLARFERGDLLAFQAAMEKDRRRIEVALLGRSRNEALRTTAREALARRDARQLVDLMLVGELSAELPIGPEPNADLTPAQFGRWEAQAMSAPLLGMGDLVDSESIASARAAIAAWRSIHQTNPEPDALRKGIVAITVAPPAADPSLRSVEALAALATLDSLAAAPTTPGSAR